ncbi:hypothetical protein SAMN04487897_10935 [Paenibacillus sp. yr247]|uniref:hypothetical protein n=1 Tax=Paenibacillus sp. yr247 TaxID=1761880 RepID=UPI0008861E52|nr:hypothetical protein [Paenibacillus sp. yr247]SDO15672.1 hypothetical protein SAMN04487897_10935 [Paenibacillus sp. yr247]
MLDGLLYTLKEIPNLLQTYLIYIAATFILIGSLISSMILLAQFAKLYKKMHEAQEQFNSLESPDQEIRDYFGNFITKTIAMHIHSFIELSPFVTRIVVLVFMLVSIGLGLWSGIRVFEAATYWKSDLPLSHMSGWIALIVGIVVSSLPFLLLHAFIQQRRAKLSHQLLPYVEDFERNYLVTPRVYESMRDMPDKLGEGHLKDMSFRLIQVMQKKDVDRIHYEFRMFEHQIGSKFSEMFIVLLREGLGLSHLEKIEKNQEAKRETKDIRVGLRALIQKMHGIKRVAHSDKPNKRDIIQVGFLTFPVLYGAYYYGDKLMGDRASQFLFKNTTQMVFFIGSIVMGIVALAVNIVVSRRKFDV